jgi:zinc protease
MPMNHRFVSTVFLSQESIMKFIRLSVCRTVILSFLFVPWPAWTAENQDVVRATLANGLRTVIVKNTLAPVVTTQMNYLVGSNETPEGFPGTAHALEHMMFRGSPELSAEQLANIIALIGGKFNADTQQTVTQYFFTVPGDDLETALHLEAERMKGILTTQELWEKERGAIEQEVAQDLSNPEYLLNMQLLTDMFKGTPYAHDALGTRPSFQQTTAAMLKQFYDTWYAPNNAILVIAGDVDPQQTLVKVKEFFESIPARPVPARAEINLQTLKPVVLSLDTDQPYGLSVVAYRLPGFESPDYAAGVILADVLKSRRGDLYALVPEGKALFTGFESDALPKAGYGFAAAGFPQGGDGNALVGAIRNIVAGYVENGIPADLVEAAKLHEITDAAFQRNSIAGLAEIWSYAVAVAGLNSPDDLVNAIRKVTVEDVNRVAREYLINHTALTAIVKPRPSGKPTASKGFGGKESFAPSWTQPVQLPTWAKKAAVVPALPSLNVKPAVTTLRNGIRLIVRQESVSPTITVIGQVKNNDKLQEPAGKEGVSSVLEDLFSYGTLSLDRLAFQKAQDDIGADISAGTSFSLRVLSERFERGMELLADNMLRPALSENAFSVVRQETIDSLRGQIQSPLHLSKRALHRALYPKNDPMRRFAKPETVASLSLWDVKAHYTRVFRPDMTTIVVIGQVTPERARIAIENFFTSWKAKGKKSQTDLRSIPLNKPSVVLVPDSSRVQDQVTLAQTMRINRSHPDYYTLQLGNHVLSGAFYATRLYRDLREKASLVYNVESFLEAGKNRSLFGVSYACDPSNVAKAASMVEHNLREMQMTDVTDHELRQAKILLLRQIPLSEASMDGIAKGLLSRSIQNLPLNEPIRAAERYRKTTAKQVRNAFAKWIRPSGFVQVTMGPNPE